MRLFQLLTNTKMPLTRVSPLLCASACVCVCLLAFGVQTEAHELTVSARSQARKASSQSLNYARHSVSNPEQVKVSRASVIHHSIKAISPDRQAHLDISVPRERLNALLSRYLSSN
jgi:hypothetical protein